MHEIIRTNDIVVLSFAQSLLKEAGIFFLVADEGMSILEGSIGMLQRRLMVPSDDRDEAVALLTDAGLGGEIRR